MRRTRKSDKYIQQYAAPCIYYLLQKWSGRDGSGNVAVRNISVLAMQVMLDMMMDLMDRFARRREPTIIVEKDGQTTLTVHDITTAAPLILRDGWTPFIA